MNQPLLPQLTVKAIALGIVLSAVLAGANAYLGLFAGATPRFDRTTVWIEPFVDSWAAAPRPRFDVELPVFREILEVADSLAANARGRYRLAFPDHQHLIDRRHQADGKLHVHG